MYMGFAVFGIFDGKKLKYGIGYFLMFH